MTETNSQTVDRFNKLYNQLQEFLLQDQEALDEELIQSEPDKIRISFYEGSCSCIRTVLLLLEHEYFKEKTIKIKSNNPVNLIDHATIKIFNKN